jgi:uncharacterized membrane protein YkoI
MSRHQNGGGKAASATELVNACSVSIQQALQLASDAKAGTVIEAKLKRKSKNAVWKIKLLTNDGLVKVYVDGTSGTILGTKIDHCQSPSSAQTDAMVGSAQDLQPRA